MSNETEINAIHARLDRPLVLIGMPAAGKSALGRRLGQALRLDFIDLDGLIEKEAGRSITTIFETEGEAAFRDLESFALAGVFERSARACVLSTGGGIILRPANRELIFGDGHAIWVRASIPVLLERAARNTDRPLLKNKDPEKILRELETARLPFYQKAAIAVDTDHRPPEQIVSEMMTKIYERVI